MIILIVPNALMNTAKRFENNLTGIFDKLLSITPQEEVIFQDSRTLFEHFLRFSEVELHIQTTIIKYLRNKDFALTIK